MAGKGCLAMAMTSGRTGLPVKTVLAASSFRSLATVLKAVAMRVTRGARKRLARPSTAFCSWMTVRAPVAVAASIAGTEA